MKLKNRTLLFGIGLLLLPFFLSMSVDEGELKKKSVPAIEFVNYEGPHKIIESLATIRGIGQALGTGILTQDRASWEGKYTLHRFYDAKVDRLSADVLVLESTAGVDHIRNLNAIVAGYLEKAFNYEPKDADLMADFITRYNAVYRGDLTYFGAAYQTQVAASLTAEAAGLAKSYTEWPGRTRIVIPLRDTVARGDKGLVNAEVVSQPKVLDQMKKDDPQALDSRKALTDLKEKEIAAEQTAIAKKEDTLKAKEAAVDQQLANPTTPEKAPAGPETKTEARPATTATNANPQPTDPTKPGAAGPVSSGPLLTTPADAAKTAQLQAEKQALTDEKKALDDKKQQNQARETALAAERTAVAKEEEKRLTAPDNPAGLTKTFPASPVVVLKLDATTSLGEFQLLDAKSGKLYNRSPVNSIRSRNYQVFNGNFLAIVGREGGDAAIRLYLFKKDDLTVAAQGTDDIAPDSPLFTSGNQFYAVTKTAKGAWVIGLFDAQLKLVAASTEAVQANTVLALVENTLAVQGQAGGIIFLDAKTLKKIGEANG